MRKLICYAVLLLAGCVQTITGTVEGPSQRYLVFVLLCQILATLLVITVLYLIVKFVINKR